MEIPQYHKRPVAAASSANEVMSSFKPILERSRHQCNGCNDLRCVLANALDGWKDGWKTMEGGFLIYWYLHEPKKIMSPHVNRHRQDHIPASTQIANRILTIYNNIKINKIA